MVSCITTYSKFKFTVCEINVFVDCSKGLEEEEPVCLASFHNFYWDNTKQDCVVGIYSGCNPTANNFEDKETCRKIARKYCLNNNL